MSKRSTTDKSDAIALSIARKKQKVIVGLLQEEKEKEKQLSAKIDANTSDMKAIDALLSADKSYSKSYLKKRICSEIDLRKHYLKQHTDTWDKIRILTDELEATGYIDPGNHFFSDTDLISTKMVKDMVKRI